jgi:polyvinyl alcohol dehydrogenase (cytochrome)
MLFVQPSSLLRRALSVAAILVCASCSRCHRGDDDPGEPVWSVWGGDLTNRHFAASERRINVTNVHRLRRRWVVETRGNVSAIPTLSTTRVYVPDWGVPLVGGSQLYALDRATGERVLHRSVLRYTRNAVNNIVRTSPAIYGDQLIFGDIRSQPSSLLDIPGGHGATLYSISRRSGELTWKRTLDAHPLAIVTQSPVVFDDRVFVGVSSFEEAASKLGHDCCSFRGSMLALDARTGRILWRRYMTPAARSGHPPFPGAAVWGSSPSIDVASRTVFIATGNNYAFPDELAGCLAAHPSDPAAQDRECYAVFDRPDNYAESILALDVDTGAVRWARKMRNFGAWTFACDPRLVPWLPAKAANCDDLRSLDYDFGQAPMLFAATVAGVRRELLGIGQKSGVFWVLDRNDGSTVWATRVGPGGVLGGMEFGAATDERRIYVQITNFDHASFRLVAGEHAGETVNGGIWAALDPATGAILWQTPDPTSRRALRGNTVHPVWGGGHGPGFFGVAMGPLTIANGVLFGGSMDRAGHMYAFDAATGRILWSFASGGSVMSAPSVDGGVVYWGSGYASGFNNDKLYAFELGPEPR